MIDPEGSMKVDIWKAKDKISSVNMNYGVNGHGKQDRDS